jgi:hypothetical protein
MYMYKLTLLVKHEEYIKEAENTWRRPENTPKHVLAVKRKIMFRFRRYHNKLEVLVTFVREY